MNSVPFIVNHGSEMEMEMVAVHGLLKLSGSNRYAQATEVRVGPFKSLERMFLDHSEPGGHLPLSLQKCIRAFNAKYRKLALANKPKKLARRAQLGADLEALQAEHRKLVRDTKYWYYSQHKTKSHS